MQLPSAAELAVVAAGVIVAIVWPLLRALIKQEFPVTKSVGVPPWLRRSLVLLAFAGVTAALVLAWLKSESGGASLTWYQGFLAGFAWESAVEKITNTRAA